MRNVWGPNISQRTKWRKLDDPQRSMLVELKYIEICFYVQEILHVFQTGTKLHCASDQISQKEKKRRNVNDPQRSLLGGLKVFEKSSTSAGQFPLTLLTSAIWAGRSIETHGFFLV